MDNDIAIKHRLKSVVERVMSLFVAKDYDALVRLAGSARFTERNIPEVAEVVSNYPADLVMPPESAYQGLMKVYEIENSSPRRWAIDMPFWTKPEGRSNLEMRVTITEDCGRLTVELDAVLVP